MHCLWFTLDCVSLGEFIIVFILCVVVMHMLICWSKLMSICISYHELVCLVQNMNNLIVVYNAYLQQTNIMEQLKSFRKSNNHIRNILILITSLGKLTLQARVKNNK